MSTLVKKRTIPIVAPATKLPPDDSQLRRDRWTAIAVVAAMLVITAAIIWLASIGGGGVEYEGIDHWYMMP